VNVFEYLVSNLEKCVDEDDISLKEEMTVLYQEVNRNYFGSAK